MLVGPQSRRAVAEYLESQADRVVEELLRARDLNERRRDIMPIVHELHLLLETAWMLNPDTEDEE